MEEIRRRTFLCALVAFGVRIGAKDAVRHRVPEWYLFQAGSFGRHGMKL